MDLQKDIEAGLAPKEDKLSKRDSFGKVIVQLSKNEPPAKHFKPLAEAFSKYIRLLDKGTHLTVLLLRAVRAKMHFWPLGPLSAQLAAQP